MYELVIGESNDFLSFIMKEEKFEGIRVDIKLPIDFVDETEDEVLLDFEYNGDLPIDDVNENVGKCFLDIYSRSRTKKTKEILEKMEASRKAS